MAYPDIERVLEAKFIKGLRRIFEFDNEFMYNDSDDNTNLIITTEFPAEEQPYKTPHIVVTGIGFQADTGQSLNNNFYRDFSMSGIRNYGSLYIAQIPYSVSLICLGQDDISRNLANKVFFYVNYRAYRYLSDHLNLTIRGVVKSPTFPLSQYPEKIFQTPLSVQGMLVLEIKETPFDYLSGTDQLGKPINSIKVSVDNQINN